MSGYRLAMKESIKFIKDQLVVRLAHEALQSLFLAMLLVAKRSGSTDRRRTAATGRSFFFWGLSGEDGQTRPRHPLPDRQDDAVVQDLRP